MAQPQPTTGGQNPQCGKNGSGHTPREDRLESWKEIAAYVNRGARTVQRWEQEEGLPVHRLLHEKRCTVFAYKGELDAWWEKRHAELEPQRESGNGTEAEPLAPNLWRRRALWPAAAVLVALASLAGWRLVNPSHSSKLPERVVPLTTYPGLEAWPSISPDGKRVAFVWSGEKDDNADVYVKQIGSDPPLRLTRDPKLDLHPAWSPDGQNIAFIRNLYGATDEIYVIPALGGPERRVAGIFTPRSDIAQPYLTWTPDGHWLVVPDKSSPGEPHALILLSAATGEKRRLTTPPPQSLGDSAPAVSPDGRRLAFSRCGTLFVCDVFLEDLGGNYAPTGAPRRLTREGAALGNPIWLPNGKELLYARREPENTTLWRVPATGSASPKQVNWPGAPGYHVGITLAGDRLVWAQAAQDRNIYRIDLPQPGGKPNPPVILASSTRIDTQPTVSPDGKRLAFLSFRSGSMEIWVCGADGADVIQLTSFGGAATTSPQWSPDGLEIAFDSRLKGQADIYVISSAGGKPRRLTDHAANDTVPTWSRDGKWTYFTSDRSGEPQIWKMPSRGGEAVPVTKRDGHSAFESPDGRYIFYAKSRGSFLASLWRIAAQGGEETEISAELWSCSNFFVADEGIYFIQPMIHGDLHPVTFYRFSTGQIERITVFDKIASCGLSLWPRNRPRHLYLSLYERGEGDLMMAAGFR